MAVPEQEMNRRLPPAFLKVAVSMNTVASKHDNNQSTGILRKNWITGTPASKFWTLYRI